MIGYGGIGAHIAARLSAVHRPYTVYGPNPHKVAIASAHKISVAISWAELLEHNDIVVSAIGGTSTAHTFDTYGLRPSNISRIWDREFSGASRLSGV